jgi:molybdate transport system permease protein
LAGLLIRAPWGDAAAVLGSAEALQALRLSLVTATISMLLVVVLGVPLAWLLARPGFRPASGLRALITVPLVLPPVVGGVALFSMFGRSGLLGRPLYELTGFALPFTPYAVVLAQTYVALPFLVLSVEGALRASDRRFEEAAATLGARPITVFRRVTLPLVGPGIAAGAVLAWARALGEFGATILFAGSLQGKTQTLPLAIYDQFSGGNFDGALAISGLLVVVSAGLLVAVRVLVRTRQMGGSPTWTGWKSSSPTV